MLAPEQRAEAVRSLTADEALSLLYQWSFWQRPSQRTPEGDSWDIWLVLAGRGFGKTRTGAEWVLERERLGSRRMSIVGRTAGDVRDVMIEGESGVLACAPPSNRPIYEPSKRRLTWPSGCVATTFSADSPGQLRGPQGDTTWADELAAWQYDDAWHQIEFGLRSVKSVLRPRAIVTTTPRPRDIIRSLVADATTHVTRGSMYENRAHLAASFLRRIERKFSGTRLGRQEIYAEVLDDAPGALWKRELLDDLRVTTFPELRAIVIAVDPATTSGEDSNETGIIVVGLGVDGHGYVLEDHSGHYTPGEWGLLVVKLYSDWHANWVIAETNQGGDLVKSNIQTAARALEKTVHVATVHASQGKRTRAEPVAALYEQGRVHHLGTLAALEDQLCSWEPEVILDDGTLQKAESPDRLDAMVYGLTHLMVDRNPKPPKPQGGRVRRGPGFEDRPIGFE